MTQNKFYRAILSLAILVAVLSGVGWVQAPHATQTIPPAQDEQLGLTVEVEGPNLVTVGDTFEVSVVASNIPDPGVFGYQFVLNWDNTTVTPVDGTLVLNPDFAVVAKSEASDIALEVAASRQGDVEDLTGPLTLLTWTFEANVVTEPDATPFTLTGVKLGRKGGVDVPVDNVIGLEVVIADVVGGSIIGQVTVEGRAGDNQAGHTVVGDGDLSTTTDATGDFSFAGVEFGTYNFKANSPGFLAATCESVVHDTDLTVLNAVVLLAGDIDDSGQIDVTDAVAIGAVFGSTTPGEVADLNADNVVDILDLILMAVNFGQTSTDNPWVCQAQL